VVARSLEERVIASANQCRALQAALDDELEIRDRLVVEALDGPYTFSQVVEWSGLSRARLNQIIARRGVA
jgi:hypothetical protein